MMGERADNPDVNENKERIVGAKLLVWGRPYTVFTKQKDYFFDDCCEVYGLQMTIRRVADYFILLQTHPDVPERFGEFVQVVAVAENGDEYLFHEDDIFIFDCSEGDAAYDIIGTDK